MDLHAWITQQVDRAEAATRAQLQGQRVAFKSDGGGPIITGAVTDVAQTPDGPQFTIAQYDVEPVSEGLTDLQSATATLRRCEADRRVLARHRAWPHSDYCAGCDADLTTRLNDCPELLDLAHAHGITPEILGGLDRPPPPETKPLADRYANGGILTPPITTSDVPEALRGHRWKPRH